MRLVVSNYLFFPGASRSLLEKIENKAKTVPQRLKPDCKCGTYGTAEAVPLSKTEYFNKLLSRSSRSSSNASVRPWCSQAGLLADLYPNEPYPYSRELRTRPTCTPP